MGQPKEEQGKQTPSIAAPGSSGHFRVNLRFGEMSDPRGRLEQLQRATESLRAQLDRHERTNQHLDSFAKELTERNRKP